MRIAKLYGVLAQVSPSPVVELNRAVAVGMAFGPAAGLEFIEALRDERALQDYQWLPSVRGDLLQQRPLTLACPHLLRSLLYAGSR